MRHSILVILFIGCLSSADDGGYRRQLDEARKRLKPEALPGDTLAKTLSNDDYYFREAATLELIRRGAADYDAVLAALQGSCPEAVRRAEWILRQIAASTIRKYRVPYEPEISLVVTSPRFWSGTNQFRGGIQDESLDANVTITSSRPLEAVTSPLPVKAGKTDAGEFVETLPWSKDYCATTSGVVYFTKPRLPFRTVEATLLVQGFTRGPPDRAKLVFKPQKSVIREAILWVDLTEPAGDGVYVVQLTDVLGRLSEAVVEFDTPDTKVPKVTVSEGAHRRTWSVDTARRTVIPKTVQISVPEPRFFVERPVKVAVAHP